MSPFNKKWFAGLSLAVALAAPAAFAQQVPDAPIDHDEELKMNSDETRNVQEGKYSAEQQRRERKELKREKQLLRQAEKNAADNRTTGEPNQTRSP